MSIFSCLINCFCPQVPDGDNVEQGGADIIAAPAPVAAPGNVVAGMQLTEEQVQKIIADTELTDGHIRKHNERIHKNDIMGSPRGNTAEERVLDMERRKAVRAVDIEVERRQAEILRRQIEGPNCCGCFC